MSDYRLTAESEPCAVIRLSDGACVPPDMANRDYNGDAMFPGYVQWKEAGNTPDPYVAPVPPEDVPTPEEEILLDHENRIRAMEGQPALTMDQFLDQVAPEAPAPAQHAEKKGSAPLPRRKR
jgi:hypothetical protein